jgi:hypothetical protein
MFFHESRTQPPVRRPDIHGADGQRAFEQVWRQLIVRIKGDPWKLTGQALDELRAKRYPDLLTAAPDAAR